MFKWVINKEEQCFVIFILFYYGEVFWEYEFIGDKFLVFDKVFKVYLFCFDYFFYNYQAKLDEEIKQVFNLKLIVVLIVMKYFYEQGYLLKQMQFFFFYVIDEYGNLYKFLFVYFFDKFLDQLDVIYEVIGDLFLFIKFEVMSIFDVYEVCGEV